MKGVKRNFYLGDEWLFYKIYMGSYSSSRFIKQTLPDILNGLQEENLIEKWFYINYRDPDKHIRLRFKVNKPECNLNKVIQIFRNGISPFISSHQINDLQVGFYARELERYGVTTIAESESLFHLNSVLMINIFRTAKKDDDVWLLGLKFADIFLETWGLTLESKLIVTRNLSDSFTEEMGGGGILKNMMSKKHRLYKNNVFEILGNPSQDVQKMALDYKTRCLAIINRIKAKRDKGVDIPELQELLGSYIHMHFNRLFFSNQRINEWLMYYFLFQYYRSKIAIEKSLVRLKK